MSSSLRLVSSNPVESASSSQFSERSANPPLAGRTYALERAPSTSISTEGPPSAAETPPSQPQPTPLPSSNPRSPPKHEAVAAPEDIVARVPSRNRMSRPRPIEPESSRHGVSRSTSSAPSFRRPKTLPSSGRHATAVARLSSAQSAADRSSVCSSNARSSLWSVDSSLRDVTFGQGQKVAVGVAVGADWVMPLVKAGAGAHEREGKSRKAIDVDSDGSARVRQRRPEEAKRKPSLAPLGRVLPPVERLAPGAGPSRTSAPRPGSQILRHNVTAPSSSRKKSCSKLAPQLRSYDASKHVQPLPRLIPPISSPASSSFPRQESPHSISKATDPSKPKFRSRKQSKLSISIKNTLNSISASFSSSSLSSHLSSTQRKDSAPFTPSAPRTIPSDHNSPRKASRIVASTRSSTKHGHLRSKSASVTQSLSIDNAPPPVIYRVDSLLQNVSTEIIQASLAKSQASTSSTPTATSRQHRSRSSSTPLSPPKRITPHTPASTQPNSTNSTQPDHESPPRLRSQSGPTIPSSVSFSANRSKHHRSLTISHPFNPVHISGSMSRVAEAESFSEWDGRTNQSHKRSATIGGGVRGDRSLWELGFGSTSPGLDGLTSGDAEGKAGKDVRRSSSVLRSPSIEQVSDPTGFSPSHATSSTTPTSRHAISPLPPSLSPVRPVSPINLNFIPSPPIPKSKTTTSLVSHTDSWDSPCRYIKPLTTFQSVPQEEEGGEERGGRVEGEDGDESTSQTGANLSRQSGGRGSQGTFGQRRRKSDRDQVDSESCSFVTAIEYQTTSRASTPISNEPPTTLTGSVISASPISTRSSRISPWQPTPSTSFWLFLDHPCSARSSVSKQL